MVGNPISDFLIQIKNAGAVDKASVTLPYSKLKHSIADALNKAGYVGDVEKKGKAISKTLKVELKYVNGVHKIKGIEIVSKPSRRLYTNAAHIKSVKNGHGSLILSTPKGILTDKEARDANVGGEMLFKIW